MNKEIEFAMEEDKLQDTLSILHKETLNYIAKRKSITEYIIDYRKKYMEEHKDDEYELENYLDQEAHVKEQAYMYIDKRLKEFTKLKESPYFGKITFNESDEGIEEFYIGRFGLTPEDTYEPVILDWRAPISSLFYKGKFGEVSYKSPDGEVYGNLLDRKQLIVKKGTLKGVFDSAIDVKDEILQMVLTTNSGSSLKDIVMTIQAEQDAVIRASRKKVVVVNGVAGSGKTTIALHRVSYLLYNYREEFGDKVLILGPNNIFMDYISQVLPTLGESNVSESTFENFAIKEIGLKEPIKTFSEYIEEAMTGNEEALKDYKYKSSQKFLDKLDEIMDEMNTSYFKIEDVKFFGEEIVGIDEIKELFTKFYSYMPLFRRSEKIRRILTSKIKDKRDEYVRNLNNDIRDKIKNLSEEELEVEKVNLEFTRKIRIREIVREVMNARDSLDKWLKHDDIVDVYKKITDTSDLGHMDLAGILYLMIKLDGKKCDKTVKHVVIDEAQDYTITQFKVLKELTGCNSYTIVGDTNQRLIKTEEEPAMLHLDRLFNEKNIEKYKLDKSYRSTQEIMEYANSYLDEDKVVPLVRHGENVIVEECTSKEDALETIVTLIEDYEEDGLESIAVIVKDKEKLYEVSKDLKKRMKITAFDSDDMIYKGGKVLIPSYYAKGLEFDGVILIDDFDDSANLVKYIMCTRALHRLSVIK